MSLAGLVLAGVVLAGCGQASVPPQVEVGPRLVVVSADVVLTEIAVLTDGSVLLARRRGGVESLQLSVAHGATPGTTLVIDASSAYGSWSLSGTVPADPGPLAVEIDIPAGQGAQRLRDEHRFSVVAGASVQAGVVITAARPGPIRVRLGAAEQVVTTSVPGERRIVFVDVPTDGPVALEVSTGAATAGTTLIPTVLTVKMAQTALEMGDVVFPADALGLPEGARPAGRVTLPAAWWRSVLRATGIGYRSRNPYSPWAFQGIPLTNSGDAAINVVVEARVVDSLGAPADPFRPKNRERDGATGLVAGLVRVPANGVTLARLPFFVDARSLPEGSSTWTRQVSVTPLGSSQPLWTRELPLQVKRGSSWISVIFALAVAGGLAGAALVVLRLGPWLRSMRTRDLVTIALFATLGFLVSGVSTVFSAAVGAALGPFSIFVTNLLDDVLRFALLATLVTLLPRPGVLGLSVLLTWLMSGIALGSFSPTDIISVGGKVLWLETLAWVVGLTRLTGWVEGPAWARWIRLGTAFSLASVLTSATSLVIAMVLYRLFYAGWYVTAVLAGPGFLYVWVACALGTGFAGSLRQVED